MIEDKIENMLTGNEARVLGVLIEKQMTTPDYYPLTLKTLLAGCNQKSSRVPVMTLSLSEVGGVVNTLRAEGLVTARMEGRSDRFEQHFSRKLRLSLETRAILCVLMLRGALTQNEIRIATARMINFDGAGVLETSIAVLTEGDDPLVLCLGRSSGQREDRYAHCLCGKPSPVIADQKPAAHDRRGTYEHRIAQLESDMLSLKAEVDTLRAGLDQAHPTCLSNTGS